MLVLDKLQVSTSDSHSLSWIRKHPLIISPITRGGGGTVEFSLNPLLVIARTKLPSIMKSLTVDIMLLHSIPSQVTPSFFRRGVQAQGPTALTNFFCPIGRRLQESCL